MKCKEAFEAIAFSSAIHRNSDSLADGVFEMVCWASDVNSSPKSVVWLVSLDIPENGPAWLVLYSAEGFCRSVAGWFGSNI